MATPTDALPRYEFHPGRPDNEPPEPEKVEMPAHHTQRDGRYRVLDFGDNRSLAISEAPNEVHEQRVLRSTAAVYAFQDATAKVAKDADLTPEGKAKRIAPHLKTAVAGLRHEWAQAEAEHAGRHAAADALYAVPAVDPTDAAGAIRDMETRRWFTGLSAEDRSALLPELVAGRLPDVARALARSPIPTGVAAHTVQDAWRASVRAQRPDEAAQLDAGIEATEWTQLLLKRVAGLLTTAPGVDAKAIKATLAEMGVQDPGPFKP